MRKHQKMRYGVKLLIIMLVYALAFGAAAWHGLNIFWDYIAAYEASRPQHAVDAYTDKLDTAYVQDRSQALINSIDHNIQSQALCRQAIAEALDGGITYARRSSECTEERTVYMLLSGGKPIGRFALCVVGTDEYGFALWEVTEESFDLSFLKGQSITVTAPCTYPVYVNGVLLSDDYIIQRDIHYQEVEQFYNDYALPYMVVYQVDGILGQLEAVITDPAGQTVSAEEALESQPVLNNCTAQEIEEVDAALDVFLTHYVAYVTNAGSQVSANYRQLSQYLVADSSLAVRMEDAKSGLKWVRDRGASVASVSVACRTATGQGQYLYNVTYVVEYNTGEQVTESVYIVFARTEDGLKAETMISH